MASSVRLGARVTACAAVIGAAGIGIGACWPQPAVVSFCGLAALLAWAELTRNLARLVYQHAEPAQFATNAEPAMDEPWAQYAPVALFRVGVGVPAQEPVNDMASRLLADMAPGELSGLHAVCAELAAGQRRMALIGTSHGKERFLLTATDVRHRGRAHKLVAIQPVESLLEAESLGAWRELSRVLAHEIVNSLTPIASLSASVQDMASALPPEIAQELRRPLDIIARRTHSLVGFVRHYRSLADVPTPQAETVDVTALFARIRTLIEPEWQARGGEVNVAVDQPSLTLMADPGQLEQALINLMRNAIEATILVPAPRILLRAGRDQYGVVRIDVIDNGPGIAPSIADRIFLPTYTTKRNGGLGLALTRQLLHVNGASIRCIRPVDGGAQFSIRFGGE